MEAIKLSIIELLFKWATFCVDWFMDFFAEPENYWVEASYSSDVTVIASVAKVLKAKVAMAPKLSIWIVKQVEKTTLTVEVIFKQMLLRYGEYWKFKNLNLFEAIMIDFFKVVRPISV